MGVPPREMDGLGVRSVVDVGMSLGVIGTMVGKAGVDTLFAASGVGVASWVDKSLFMIRILGQSDVAFAKGVDGNVAMGASSPVAAANFIWVDSGTAPLFTHGRTVNCLFGRSRP